VKKSVAVLVAIVAVALAACTTPSGGGSDGGAIPPYHYGGICAAKVVAYGDSITAPDAAFGVTPWPAQIGGIVNVGFSGDTALHQANRAIYNTVYYCAPKPQRIYFLAGINDIVFHHATAAAVESYYSLLIAKVGVPVTFITLTPLPANSPWMPWNPIREQVNAWLRAGNAPSVVDCNAKLQGPDGFLNPSYDYDHVIHLNTAGEAVLAGCVSAAG
jgi:hypothetical protein